MMHQFERERERETEKESFELDRSYKLVSFQHNK